MSFSSFRPPLSPYERGKQFGIGGMQLAMTVQAVFNAGTAMVQQATKSFHLDLGPLVDNIAGPPPATVTVNGGMPPGTTSIPVAVPVPNVGVGVQTLVADMGAATLLVYMTGKPASSLFGKFATDAQLQDHSARHGNDFGATTAAEYEAQANAFLNGPRGSNVLEKVRPNGDIVRYNPATDEFGVVRSDGVIRTYYKPDPNVHGYPTNLDYFYAQ